MNESSSSSSTPERTYTESYITKTKAYTKILAERQRHMHTGPTAKHDWDEPEGEMRLEDPGSPRPPLLVF